ncbi:MAG TPA: hypothetical protein DEA08_33360 [Planctomycetes bacterium]|nr:hypothetical protein [Planctomycetota bacterium]
MYRRPTPTGSLGIPPAEVKPTSWGRRVAGVAVLVALAAGLARVDWAEVYLGRGYAPWYEQTWQARQDSDYTNRPLVVLRAPKGELPGNLIDVLDHPEVQRRVGDCVWLREESEELTITLEEPKERAPHVDPLPLAELTPGQLVEAINQALVATPGPRRAMRGAVGVH